MPLSWSPLVSLSKSPWREPALWTFCLRDRPMEPPTGPLPAPADYEVREPGRGCRWPYGYPHCGAWYPAGWPGQTAGP
jgi:hypothetical protein